MFFRLRNHEGLPTHCCDGWILGEGVDRSYIYIYIHSIPLMFIGIPLWFRIFVRKISSSPPKKWGDEMIPMDSLIWLDMFLEWMLKIKHTQQLVSAKKFLAKTHQGRSAIAVIPPPYSTVLLVAYRALFRRVDGGKILCDLSRGCRFESHFRLE